MMSCDPVMRGSSPVMMHRATAGMPGRSPVRANRLDLWWPGVSVMSVSERTESRKRQPEGQRQGGNKWQITHEAGGGEAVQSFLRLTDPTLERK